MEKRTIPVVPIQEPSELSKRIRPNIKRKANETESPMRSPTKLRIIDPADEQKYSVYEGVMQQTEDIIENKEWLSNKYYELGIPITDAPNICHYAKPTQTSKEKIVNTVQALHKFLAKSCFVKTQHFKRDVINTFTCETLDLSSRELEIIPSAVWEMENIEALVLRGNKLSDIPDDIKKLKKLKYLILDWNNFTSIPKVVYSLRNLKLLSMRNNRIRQIDNEIGQMKAISHFLLTDNQLEDIPKEVDLLNRLEYLALANNKITALPELRSLENLTYVNLHENNLGGGNVNSLNNLCSRNVRYLDISRNGIKKLPPSLGNFTQLRECYFQQNKLKTLPKELRKLKKLELLCVRENKLQRLRILKSMGKNLEILDVRKNQLAFLPKQITSFKKLKIILADANNIESLPTDMSNLKLEKLFLRDNKIKVVPKSIFKITTLNHLDLKWNKLKNSSLLIGIDQLQNLQWLDLSKNKLTSLPHKISSLKKLKILVLSDNKIKKLPEDIHKLRSLEWLNCHDNNIDRLPETFPQLSKLSYLSLSNNTLKKIPENFGDLCNLKHLDFRNNKLKHLPASFVKFKGRVEKLFIQNNQLVKPPQEFCEQGESVVFKYFADLQESKEVVTGHHKVLILGDMFVGKTSVAQTLIQNESVLIPVGERTEVIEQTPWKPEHSLIIQVNDFGGNEIYDLTHKFFLTPRGTVLLVFNCSNYKCTSKDFVGDFDKYLGKWIKNIQLRAPGAHVHFVGTHSDAIPQNAKTSTLEEVQRDIKVNLKRMITDRQNYLNQAIKNFRSDIKHKISKIRSSSNELLDKEERRLKREKIKSLRIAKRNGLQIEDKVYFVSCTISMEGIPALRQKVIQESRESKITLPAQWASFRKSLLTNEKLKNENKFYFPLKEVMKKGKLETETKMSILKYMRDMGLILFYPDYDNLKEKVFHDIDIVRNVLKRLCSHLPEKKFDFNRQIRPTISLKQEKFDLAKAGFLKCGVMSESLLRLIFEDIVPEQKIGTLVDLLLSLDLCYEVDQIKMGENMERNLLFPWLNKTFNDSRFDNHWTSASHEHVTLAMQFEFSGYIPENVFEQLTVILLKYIKASPNHNYSTCYHWKSDSVAVCNGNSFRMQRMAFNPNCVKLYVRPVQTIERMLNLEENRNDLHVKLEKMWGILIDLREKMCAKIKFEWPGAEFDTSLLCTHCLLEDKEEVEKFTIPGQDVEPLNFDTVSCYKYKEEVPAILVCPPYITTVTTDRILQTSEYLRRMLETKQKTTMPKNIPSNHSFLNDVLERRLGEQWAFIGIYLGVKFKELKCLRENYPRQSYNRNAKMLSDWINQQEDQGACRRDYLLIMKRAFKRCERKDLSDLIPLIPDFEDMESTNEDHFLTGEIELTEACMADRSQIIGDQWRDIGRQLGFTDSRISALEEDFPTHTRVRTLWMLCTWLRDMDNDNGGNASLSKLNDAIAVVEQGYRDIMN